MYLFLSMLKFVVVLKNAMTISVENFLKRLYELLFDRKEKATPGRLAEKLNISAAAVTDMAKKLASQDLIVYEKYKELEITSKGEEVALNVIRRHRLWELFLHKILHIPLEKVHMEAESLEHQTSDYLISVIEQFLDYPQFDPHGDPIPDVQGNMPETSGQKRLHKVAPGVYTIERMTQQSQEIGNFFKIHGFELGKKILLDQVLKDIDALVIEIDKKKLVITSGMAKNIYVR